MFLIICVADIRQIIRAHVQSIPNLATQYFFRPNSRLKMKKVVHQK